MANHHLLPPEIWVDILRWATTSPREHELITEQYTPFQSTVIDKHGHDPVIATKRNIVLVCRNWNRWANTFLYENLVISKGVDELKDSLTCNKFGLLVRRAVLPYSSTNTSYPPKAETTASLDVLKACKNITTLARPRIFLPQPLNFSFDSETVSLQSLKRLDWWHNGEAARTGGINSLYDVLRCAPNLRYLSVGGIMGQVSMSPRRMNIHLPLLKTLRLQWSNGIFLRQLVDLWHLPSLTHVAIDFPMPDVWHGRIWETYGEQLQVVEYGKHMRFLLEDHLSICLSNCPNLIKVNYHLFFLEVPNKDARHDKLIEIGLHAAVNELLKDSGRVLEHIEEHFEVLLSDKTFPALKTIRMYGEWRGIIGHPMLAYIWPRAGERHIKLIAT